MTNRPHWTKKQPFFYAAVCPQPLQESAADPGRGMWLRSHKTRPTHCGVTFSPISALLFCNSRTHCTVLFSHGKLSASFSPSQSTFLLFWICSQNNWMAWTHTRSRTWPDRAELGVLAHSIKTISVWWRLRKAEFSYNGSEVAWWNFHPEKLGCHEKTDNRPETSVATQKYLTSKHWQFNL